MVVPAAVPLGEAGPMLIGRRKRLAPACLCPQGVPRVLTCK